MPRIPSKPTGYVRSLGLGKNVTSQETHQLLKEVLSMFKCRSTASQKEILNIFSLEWLPPPEHLEGLAFTQIELYNPEVPLLACQRGWDEAGGLVVLELATRWELCTGVGDWPHLANCLAVVALTWTSIAGWNNSSGTRMLTGTASRSLACHPKKWALRDVCFSSLL